MALTEQQVNMVMSQSVEQIKKYITQGLIQFPDDLAKYKDTPKYKAIEKELSSIPSHEAVNRWKEIEAMGQGDSAALAAALSDFISASGRMPATARSWSRHADSFHQ